jgi:hypothetical protein
MRKKWKIFLKNFIVEIKKYYPKNGKYFKKILLLK